MEKYTGKTVEEALQNASEDTGTPVEQIIYTVSPKMTGIFNKKMVIEVYDMSDIVRFAEDYLLNVLDNLTVESSVDSKIDGEIIRLTIDSTHNPILIGKGGKTLQALAELVRLATNNRFHKRFRIFLDINGYKDHKYNQLQRTARKCARDVQKTKTTYVFDPMSSDERRVIHNACSGLEHIKTESKGEGKNRQVQIIYVD